MIDMLKFMPYLEDALLSVLVVWSETLDRDI